MLVENFKVGGLEEYGLDYASLHALNPRLICCSVTGFGQDGPYAERAGYDLMIQTMSGMMSITGRADTEPGGDPLRVGVAVTDLFTGIYASTAILTALEARLATSSARVVNRSTLIPLMEEVTRTRTTANWIAPFEDKAVPCGPINNIAQAFGDAQVRARGLVLEQTRWAEGEVSDGVQCIRSVASPRRLSANPAVLRNAAPALGQHTVEVLRELGLVDARIAELKKAGVV